MVVFPVCENIWFKFKSKKKEVNIFKILNLLSVEITSNRKEMNIYVYAQKAGHNNKLRN